MKPRILALLALWVAGPRPACGEDGPPPPRASVAVAAARDTLFVGETFTLRWRIGWDAADFAAHAVPTFARPADVALHVRAPGLEGLPGAVPAPRRAPARDPGAVVRVAVGDGVVEAERARGEPGPPGWTHAVVERRWRAATPGEITVPAPTLRFVRATAFRDDFVQGRVPQDAREVLVEGTPLVLRVLPLPLEGRPAGFQDAVGRFTLHASLAPEAVEVGGTVRLTLVVEGVGNLETLTPPSLAGLPGFHLFGATDDRGPERRTIVYDLSPRRSDLTEVPPIVLPHFDPEPPAGYRTARTPAIPLRVRPGPGGDVGPPPEGTDGARAPSRVPWGTAGAAGALVLLAWGGVAWRRRLRRGGPPADPQVRRRAAAEAFAHAWGRPGADRAAAFGGFLAVLLDQPPAAVVSPDLARRLQAVGVPASQAGRAAAAMEALVGARYGGAAPSDDVVALVAELVPPARAPRP